jgi:hypothetical protein
VVTHPESVDVSLSSHRINELAAPIAVLATALGFSGGGALAHHSRAGFDMDSVAVYQGTVASVSWTNPHVYITVDLADDQGEWIFETDAIPILRRSGWSAASITVGEQVLVRGNPGNVAAERHALLASIETAGGTVLTPRSHFERGAGTASDRVPADSLEGTWELPFGDVGDFMQRWAAIELTPAGAAGQAAFRPQDRPAGKCIGTPTPMLMGMPYLNEIEFGDDIIYLRSEFLNAERTIFMDGREHPTDGQRTNQGHSIGRWENETLVIDTVLFDDHRAPIRGPNEGVPSGSKRHVEERYTLSEDGTSILIEFEVDDPEFLAEPFTGTLRWVHVTEYEPMGFDCPVIE